MDAHLRLDVAGLDNMSHVSSRSQMSAECAGERETRTLVVKNVNPDVSDAEFKQLFEVSTCKHSRSLILRSCLPVSASCMKD